MRHSFVSLLSDSGVPIENIARLVGHAGGSAATETVYRKQIRPVLLEGAEAMDLIFPPARPSHRRSVRRSLPTEALSRARERASELGAAYRNRTDDLFITRVVCTLPGLGGRPAGDSLIELSLVDFAAMPDLDDEQHEFTVAHLIDDPVVTDADAQPAMLA
jgi:hypothetical protein